MDYTTLGRVQRLAHKFTFSFRYIQKLRVTSQFEIFVMHGLILVFRDRRFNL